MDAGMEKECSALGGLFQTIMNDMKASYPVWEDFVTKGAKLQSQLRTTIIVTGSFLDAFQKVADIATGTRGATKEIGSALTRMCMRHRSIESKLKLFTAALMDNLIGPLELKIEEWKKVSGQLDKDHAKGKDEVRMQLDSALQDVNIRYAELEETEKRAVCRALVEERGRFCSFVTMLKPVLDEEIGMLGEVTHLQSILEDLCSLTAEPNTLPPASEQVILDLKGSDYSYSYQTPPASPSNTLSRKSSISSNYASVRHVPSLDSISSAVDGLHLRETRQDQSGVNTQSWAGQTVPGTENGTGMPPPHLPYSGERVRAQSTSGKPQSAREQLALTLSGGLNSEAPRTSRDSLHCSSGYSTQTTTPSCSEDTIPSQHAVKKEPPLYDYDYISLHGGDDTHSQSDFDKSSTIPRNSDLSQNYRKLFQNKRPASTVSLLVDPEPLLQPQTATIRRKPSSKPSIRRGTISGGVPIPICTPQVPLKPSVSTVGLASARSGSEEAMCPPAPAQTPRTHGSDLAHAKHTLCTSTQSLSAMPPPYYAMFPGQPPAGSTEQLYQLSKQQQYALHQQQQRQYQQQYNQHNQQHQQQQHQQQQQYNQQQHQQHQQQQQYNQQQHQQHQQQQQYNQQQHQQHQQQQQYNQQQHQQHQQQQYHQQQQQQHLYNQQQLQQNQQLYSETRQPPQYQQKYNPALQHQQHPQLHQQHQQAPQKLPQQQQEPPQHPVQHQPVIHHLQQQNSLQQQQHPNPTGEEHLHGAAEPDQTPISEGGDMLKMIRRGVKLRRTLTNDRSAPLITTNYLD
uniref:MTSS I-BAR domain containing 1 n=1 Tax=Astyanax mexicanus TaxID=7994 RepID=A0A3B1JPV9_ASTMX